MRREVVKTIYEHALQDPRIFFLTADLGHALMEEFQTNLPKQYVNIGVAEQNMIGIAAGLALSGNRVFVYSITPFSTMRCYEQIKVDVCYQNIGVVVIGVGAGYAYSNFGCTHHAIEDIAIMRVLPNMKIFSPANPFEAGSITKHLISQSYPAYLRIGKGGESNPEKEYEFDINRGLIIRPGTDIAIFSTGAVVSEAVRTSQILEDKRISTEVISIHSLKPLDTELVTDRAANRKAIFVIEEHNIIGGLGSAIAEVICESDIIIKPTFKRFGVPDKYVHLAGSQDFMRKQCGFSAEQVAEQILFLIKRT